jgi:hypothetical protein
MNSDSTSRFVAWLLVITFLVALAFIMPQHSNGHWTPQEICGLHPLSGDKKCLPQMP